MRVEAYMIVEPGADRPFFSHVYPQYYTRKPGSKVFKFTVDVPGFMMHEVIELMPVEGLDVTSS